MTVSPNRVVAVLTPLVFAPLAGAISAWLTKQFPGTEGATPEVFLGGAVVALAPALQWLHGWQKYEARQDQLTRDLALADMARPATEPAYDELPDYDYEAPERDDFMELAELAMDAPMSSNGS